MNNKNLKEILIKAPEGMEIDMELFNSSKRIEFIKEKREREKIEYPTKLDLSHLKEGWYILNEEWYVSTNDFESNNNILPTKKLAEQMKTFTKLITMRERYREIELLNNPKLKPIDWSDSFQCKRVIFIKYNKFNLDYTDNIGSIFSFLTPEARDKFYESFRDELYFIKDLIQ